MVASSLYIIINSNNSYFTARNRASRMKIEHNFSLLPYNTFRIDAKARYFVNIESSSDFIELMQTAERLESENKLFIGGGSNMLLTEPIFEGMVIHNGILGKEISSDSPHEMFLKVGG